MKIRNDFVTNSSSSSFIVATDATTEIPEQFKPYFTKLSQIPEIIEALDNYWEVCHLFGDIGEDYVKTQYNLTDKQMGLLKASKLDKLEEFDNIMDQLDAGRSVYSVVIDWDWSICADIKNYIRSLIVIDSE